MTTLEQFVYYKNFAYQVFEYLRSKINRYIIPVLEVDYADMINYTFANNRKPNIITLHIDNLVYEAGNGYNKNKVCSMIFIALTHELFHVEQSMSQEMYRSDYNYKVFIESAVEKKTLMFLVDNSKEILNLFGVYLDLSYFDINDIGNGKYESIGTVEGIYRSTIMNVIFRKDFEYRKFEHDILNKYNTIYIGFENGPNFLIKGNGEFCESTLNEFISAVGCFAGKYDRYTVNVRMEKKPYREQEEIAAQVIFTLSNRCLYPMVFRNHF